MTNKTRYLVFLSVLTGGLALSGCEDDYFVGSTHSPVVVPVVTPECTSNSDCADKGDKTECSAAGVCVVPAAQAECTSNADCADREDGKTECNTEGVCVVPAAQAECTSNADCADREDGKTECDTVDGVCVEPKPECTSNADCADREDGKSECDTENGVCVEPKPECTSNEDCADHAEGKTECDIDNGVCIVPLTCGNEKLDDGEECDDALIAENLEVDCGTNKKLIDSPVCGDNCKIDLEQSCELDPEKAECLTAEGCLENEEGKLSCDLSVGVCVECQADADCAEKEDGRTKCDVDNKVCVVPPECESHADCADKEDGRVRCDTTEGKCYAPECVDDTGCAGNNEGKTRCNVEEGVCILPIECTKNADCTGREDGKVICDTVNNLCIEPSTHTLKPCKYPDADGDGIADEIERKGVDAEGNVIDDPDSDNDGTPDYLDKDSDGDTIPDSIEGGTNGCSSAQPVDSDGDTIPDYRDLDSDDNGIADSLECGSTPGDDELVASCVDTDGDGVPDFQDDDNDGDYVLDIIEIVGMVNPADTKLAADEFSGDCNKDGKPDKKGTPDTPIDCNGNGIPDYMDLDSDSDRISDADEGQGIVNGGRFYSRYLTDADGDGITDSQECAGYKGSIPAEGSFFVSCVDTLRNGIPDYLELDSDNDGLSDAIEHSLGSNWTKTDTDGDGQDDLAEYTAEQFAIQHGIKIIRETMVADTARGGTCQKVGSHQEYTVTPGMLVNNKNYKVDDIFDFFFELPPDGPAKSSELRFIPAVSKLDVVFNMDTTGSMGGEVLNLRNRIGSYIIPQIKSFVSDSGFGVTRFDDFPVSGYGGTYSGGSTSTGHCSSGGTDTPYELLGTVSTNSTTVQNNVNKLCLHYGGDGDESGYQALWQIVKGDDKSKPLTSWSGGSMSYHTPAANTWGGVDFRNGTLPVVVHITDVTAHDPTNSSSYNSSVVNPYYSTDVHAAYLAKGARVISIYRSGGSQLSQLVNTSKATKAIVPACSFKKSATQWTCGENRCCTTTSSSGVAPDSNNNCVLSYGISSASTMSDTLVSGVSALVKYGTYEVSTNVRRDPKETKVNTACFIQKVEAKQYVAPCAEPEKSCNPTAKLANVKTTAYKDGFTDFAPGTANELSGAELLFTVTAKNNGCVAQTEEPQIFTAYIDVVNPTTGLVFGTREVKIIVPGKLEGLQGD